MMGGIFWQKNNNKQDASKAKHKFLVELHFSLINEYADILFIFVVVHYT
jgi:hypothetical protein